MVGLRSLEVQMNFYHSFFRAIHITPQEYFRHETQSIHIVLGGFERHLLIFLAG